MSASARPSVLVVDDDPVCLRHACAVLEDAGYACTGCGSAADAHAALARDRFDCVLADLGLPDGTALDLVPSLAARVVPLIAMSAELPPPRRARLVEAGCHAALQKPVEATLLVECVVAALSGLPFAVGSASTASHDVLLDEGEALAVAGAPDIAAGLRVLLRAELPAHRDEIASAFAAGDARAVGDVLHRLRAACGFCGATRLRLAGDALASALAAGTGVTAARERFDDALAATQAALAASAGAA